VSVHQTGEWRFHPGPLFSNVVVIDEVNRCTPRTQAALLEAMEEHQISVDGTTRPLPQPFFVVATQNPHEHAGTFPLVEGQRDRFTLVTSMGYPDRDAERSLLLGQGGEAAFAELGSVTTPDAVAAAIAATRSLYCSGPVADYVLDVATATRVHPDVALGASPRAALSLLHASQAHAVLSGRTYVSPADVQAVARPVLTHRLILHGGPDLAGAGGVVSALLDQLPVPRE